MYFRFRDFPLYNDIRNFISDIYKIAQNLPNEEKYALSSQLRRASTSILLNVAEGSMYRSDMQFHKFLLISLGSVGEVVAILDICLDQNYISSSIHEASVVKCVDIEKQLYSFCKSLAQNKKF